MKLRNLANDVFPQPGELPICESCGESFTCGASLKGCWCGDVTLSDEARRELRVRYERCLCRKCLEKFATNEASE